MQHRTGFVPEGDGGKKPRSSSFRKTGKGTSESLDNGSRQVVSVTPSRGRVGGGSKASRSLRSEQQKQPDEHEKDGTTCAAARMRGCLSLPSTDFVKQRKNHASTVDRVNKNIKDPKVPLSWTGPPVCQGVHASSATTFHRPPSFQFLIPPCLPVPPISASTTIKSKLRVGVFNACKRMRDPHPAAVTCLAALLRTPWFHSEAVARLLGATCLPGSCRRPHLTYVSPVEASLLHADDIRTGRLLRPNGQIGHGFDVLVIPGGSVKKDLRVLGRQGLEKIKQFVNSGGGYCGICAGAFLASKHLKMVDVCRHEHPQNRSDDEGDGGDSGGSDASTSSCNEDEESEKASPKKPDAMRRRDPCIVKAHFSKLGRRLLWSEGRPKHAEEEVGPDGSISLRYHNGPLVEVPTGAKSRTLCRMWPAEEIAHAAAAGLSGSAAIVMQKFGTGRAVIISPHPESTQESGFGPEPGKIRLRRILQRAVLLAASGPDQYSWIRQCCHKLG